MQFFKSEKKNTKCHDRSQKSKQWEPTLNRHTQEETTEWK